MIIEQDGFPQQIQTCIGVENCGGSAELYHNVLETFINEGRKKLPLIKKLYIEENWTEFVVAVHGLKGAAATVGAMELSAFAKKIEVAGKEGNIELIREKTEGLINEYLVLLQMLAAFWKEKTHERKIEYFEKHGC